MILVLSFLIGGSVSFSQHKDVRYKDLVNRLTDLKALSILPAEGEGSAMWSSYDRKSKVDPVTGAFIEWSANNDGLRPQYIRKEGENIVQHIADGYDGRSHVQLLVYAF